MDIFNIVYLVSLLIYFIIFNCLGYFSMYSDKKRAINNKWRISESMLLTICLFGGGIGSLIGMRVQRHKIRHRKFTIGVPILLVISYTLIGILSYVILTL